MDITEGELVNYYRDERLYAGYFRGFIKRMIRFEKKRVEAAPLMAFIEPIGPSKRNRIKVAVNNIRTIERKTNA